MITLVTKQDLWWNERNKVKDHYMNGEYNSTIEKVMGRRGRNNFAHEYVSASLVLSNFSTSSGELLAPNTAGYDQNIQLENLLNLFKTVDRF